MVHGFWCSDGLAEHGFHFWNNSSNIVVERNTIIDCDRGIGFGLGTDGNAGGIIRNNMIYHGPGHGYSDVGISVKSTPNAQVYNNTVFHDHSYSAIEYRFADTSNILIANNLTNRPIDQRDGASGQVVSNLTTAQSSWFVDPAGGNLHLQGSVAAVVDKGISVAGLTDDFDRDNRPQGRGRLNWGPMKYRAKMKPGFSPGSCSCSRGSMSLPESPEEKGRQGSPV